MTEHIPVLVNEVLNYLNPKPGEAYLDVTAGWGGHAQAVLARTKNPSAAVLIDRDKQAVSVLQARSAGAQIIQQDFLSASRDLANKGRRFDLILADLGASSPQLDDAKRGFSLKASGPLDMRMDDAQTLRAADIVNQASETELMRLFRDWGEEPKARQIAREIVRVRPLRTTDQLATIAAKAWPRGSRIHPATRIFQALRIAVNDELNQLKEALPIWLELLNGGGRIVVISFHSLEDRIVKRFFAEHSLQSYGGQLKILTKKPIAAQQNEIVLNPRARSAKLRAAAKTKIRKD